MGIIYSKVTTGPAVEPVDADAIAKLDLKVDASDEDGLIDILLQAARETVEMRTGRSLITQSREIKLDYFPKCDTIRVPFGPLQTVVVKYYDTTDTEVTLASSNYWVDTHSDVPRIVIKTSWPSTYDRPNAVKVEYTAGYGNAGSNVPAPLRKAVLLLLGHFYENRQNVIVSGSPTGALELPYSAEVLMAPYVVEHDITY